MSHDATNWAVKVRGLKPAAKVVLWHLADHHNPTYGCFPSQKTLAESCEMSERSVRDQLMKLEEVGLIRRQHAKTRVGQFGSDRYFLAFEKGFGQRQNLPAAESANGKNASEPAANSRHDQRQNLPPNPVREPLIEPVMLSVVPTSPAPPPPDPKSKPKNASSLPDNWVPSDRNLADAYERGFHDQEIFDVAARFRDYHLAKGTRFKDWNAGWRTWLGNERRFSRNTGSSSPHSKLSAAFARTAHKLDRSGL